MQEETARAESRDNIMDSLKFESDLLSKTDRYSSDFSLPDYIYNDKGELDREKTAQLLLSEEYGYVKSDGIKLDVSETGEPPAVPNASGYQKHIRFSFKLTKGDLSASFPVDLFIPEAMGDIPFIVALDFSISEELNYFPLQLLCQSQTVQVG